MNHRALACVLVYLRFQFMRGHLDAADLAPRVALGLEEHGDRRAGELRHAHPQQGTVRVRPPALDAARESTAQALTEV